MIAVQPRWALYDAREDAQNMPDSTDALVGSDGNAGGDIVVRNGAGPKNLQPEPEPRPADITCAIVRPEGGDDAAGKGVGSKNLQFNMGEKLSVSSTVLIASHRIASCQVDWVLISAHVIWQSRRGLCYSLGTGL